MTRSLLLSLVCFGIPSLAFGQFSYDVRADWSDVFNPNGTWAYRQGTTALPLVSDWTPLGAATPQPAWASGSAGGSSLPAIFRAASNPAPADLDWQVGDVVIHTTDNANGPGFAPANVAWTSPGAGKIGIAGGVWEAREIGRSNRWALLLNATELSAGDIATGDSYSRSNPFAFATGAGGASSLTDVQVSPGDTVQLLLTRTSDFGDFVGASMTITFTPVPDPGGMLGMGCLALGVAMRFSNSNWASGRAAFPQRPRANN